MVIVSGVPGVNPEIPGAVGSPLAPRGVLGFKKVASPGVFCLRKPSSTTLRPVPPLGNSKCTIWIEKWFS